MTVDSDETNLGLSTVYGKTSIQFIDLNVFCGFSMGRNQYWAGRVYDLCVYYMTGTPEGSTESVFLWRSRESNLRPLVYKA